MHRPSWKKIMEAAIETNRVSKFSVPQKRLHKLEQVNKQPLDIRPTLSITSQHFWHEAPVTNQLKPRKTEEIFPQTNQVIKQNQGIEYLKMDMYLCVCV